MSEKRVALFVANYAFGSSAQPANAAITLATRGFDVDILLYRAARSELASLPSARIRVHDLGEPDRSRREALRRCLPTTKPEYRVLPHGVFERARAILAGKRYSCFVGIESGGLILAGLLGQELGVPYLYWSLELYVSDNPYARHGGRKPLERKYHRESLATIVQDEQRARILLEDNGVRGQDVYLVPVSLLGEPIRTKSRWLHERLQLPDGRKAVLQFGRIHAHRLSPDVVRAAQGFPEDWLVVMHGSASEAEVAELRALDAGGRVTFSTELVPLIELGGLISSADVGLALYVDDHANTLLIGSSSEKLARYLQAGLPVVANDFPSLQRVLSSYRCGVCVSSPDGLRAAIDQILLSYDELRENAFRCYEERYEFTRHFIPVAERLESLG